MMIEQFGNATYMKFDPPHKIADLGNNFGNFEFLFEVSIHIMHFYCNNVVFFSPFCVGLA